MLRGPFISHMIVDRRPGIICLTSGFWRKESSSRMTAMVLKVGVIWRRLPALLATI